MKDKLIPCLFVKIIAITLLTILLLLAGCEGGIVTPNLADSDGDGIPDVRDNCPKIANPDQYDSDRDGFGDACDPYDNLREESVVWNDNLGKYEWDPDADYDGDGVPDVRDNCPKIANPDQYDSDRDGFGDACDGFDDLREEFKVWNENLGKYEWDPDADYDGDGVPDVKDNCPEIPNDQKDTDGDGIGDACDSYDDIHKESISQAPSGRFIWDPEADYDGDGIPDVKDNCPDIVNPNQEDTDGDGIGDACDQLDNKRWVEVKEGYDWDTGYNLADDIDNDGWPNSVDNCPDIVNPNQEDTDGDGIGDACDPYDEPYAVAIVWDEYLGKFRWEPESDYDRDGKPDRIDNCPEIANPGQEDTDKDGIGDACDPYDNINREEKQLSKTTGLYLWNPSSDYDEDTVPNDVDNCPEIPNLGQKDTDRDGIGDACDPYDNLKGERRVWNKDLGGYDWSWNADYDEDGIPDVKDNCPEIFNPKQNDVDKDGIGDACDPYDNKNNREAFGVLPEGGYDWNPLGDLDQDGVVNNVDNCPDTPNGDQDDRDGDGIGDACDPYDNVFGWHIARGADGKYVWGDWFYDSTYPALDTDKDGVVDPEDNCPNDPNKLQEDTDGDGIGDACDPYDNVNKRWVVWREKDVGWLAEEIIGYYDWDPNADYDGDGKPDRIDNCPYVINPNQKDTDKDGIGDVCDPYDERTHKRVPGDEHRFYWEWLEPIDEGDVNKGEEPQIKKQVGLIIIPGSYCNEIGGTGQQIFTAYAQFDDGTLGSSESITWSVSGNLELNYSAIDGSTYRFIPPDLTARTGKIIATDLKGFSASADVNLVNPEPGAIFIINNNGMVSEGGTLGAIGDYITTILETDYESGTAKIFSGHKDDTITLISGKQPPIEGYEYAKIDTSDDELYLDDTKVDISLNAIFTDSFGNSYQIVQYGKGITPTVTLWRGMEYTLISGGPPAQISDTITIALKSTSIDDGHT